MMRARLILEMVALVALIFWAAITFVTGKMTLNYAVFLSR